MESCKIYNIIKTSHTHNICYYILHVNGLCICITFTVSLTQMEVGSRLKQDVTGTDTKVTVNVLSEQIKDQDGATRFYTGLSALTC